MRAIFGPVLSRRLGRSLGIDPFIEKSCDWNCIYCQLGRTRRPRAERRPHRALPEVLGELDEVLREVGPGEIDWITIVGSGEPTLDAGLGALIDGIRERTTIPLAVITNGSLLVRPDVREELARVDAVLPSLSGGSERLFRRIHRPARGLTLRDHVRGLAEFRAMYRGHYWLEVMLIHDLNTTEEALCELGAAIERIKPDAIHVLLPTRPPAEPRVEPATREDVARAVSVLSRHATILAPLPTGEYDALGIDDPVTAAVDLVARHPVTDEEMRGALARWSGDAAGHALAVLRLDPRVRLVDRVGQRFWVSASGFYPGERRT